MPHNEPSMTGTIDERVEGTPAYTKPFEMRFVAFKKIMNETTGLRGGAEVYFDGKNYGVHHVFELGYTERKLVEGVEDISSGKAHIMPLAICRCVQLFFTPQKKDQTKIELSDQHEPTKNNPPIASVTLARQDVAYTLCKFLNGWYKYHTTGKKLSYEEMRWYSADKSVVLRLFNRSEIRERFKQDGIRLYDFAGVPDWTERKRVIVPKENVKPLINSLEEELQKYVREKKQKKGIDNDKYIYILKNGKVVNLTVGNVSETQKEIKIEIPEEQKKDEPIFDIIVNIWRKKEGLSWATR